MVDGKRLPPCDLARACCKCGSDDINTQWVKEIPFLNSKRNVGRRACSDRLAEEEHMARYCRVCSYQWAEAPLDQCSAIDRLAAKAGD